MLLQKHAAGHSVLNLSVFLKVCEEDRNIIYAGHKNSIICKKKGSEF